MKTLGNAKASKHTYEVGTEIDGKITKVEVHANSRAGAAKLVERDGMVVRDVNMVG